MNITVYFMQLISHGLIGIFHLSLRWIREHISVRAPIVLQVVYSPVGIGLSVFFLKGIAAFMTSTGLWTGRGVDPHLESERMDISTVLFKDSIFVKSNFT